MRTTEIPAPAHGATAAASLGRTVYDPHRVDYGMSELGTDPRRLLVGVPAESADKKVKDFNAVLLVQAHDTDKARGSVEAILHGEVRRYRLAEIVATSKGKGVLIARGAPNVIGTRIH